jgi:ABC-type multidrug transport system fused ATPase/permease subunit
MLLLFKAALRNSKHLVLLLISFLTLIFLTIANFLEISALGVLMKSDTLSQLMSGKAASSSTLEAIGNNTDKNPLQWVIGKLQGALGNVSSFRVLITVLISVALFKAITLFWSRYMTQLMAIRVSRDLRMQYFEHIQALPMSFYQKHNIGSLSSRVVGDAGQIATSINSALTNYLHTPFTVLLTLIACFYSSWQLSMVIFLGIPMVAIPIITLAKRVKRVTRQLQSNQEKFASVLIDFLAGIQTVKIFAMESF